MRALRTIALAVALCAGAAPALAAGVDPASATPVQREQAQARFVRGRQLFDQRSFDAAAAEFRASHEIVASPNTRLYLARTLRELGRNIEAYVELGRTEIEAREQMRVDDRYRKAGEAAADERAAMRKKLGFVTVRVANATDETKLVVGGEEIRRGGFGEPIPVTPGPAEIRLETPGREPVKSTVNLEAGGTATIDMDVSTGASITAEAPAPAAEPPRDATTEPPSLKPFAFAAGGVAVLGAATFTIFGLMATGTHDDLVGRCPNGACPTDPKDDVSSGKTQSTIANVGLVVGGVGLAAAITLFVLDAKRNKPSTAAGAPAATFVRPALGLGHVGMEGRF